MLRQQPRSEAIRAFASLPAQRAFSVASCNQGAALRKKYRKFYYLCLQKDVLYSLIGAQLSTLWVVVAAQRHHFLVKKSLKRLRLP
jgi:hypothetical protein